MAKLTFYFVLVISYLGLSTANQNRERGNLFVTDESMLHGLFYDSPICVLLVGQYSSGYFFKTYFHQYKIVYGFRSPEFLVVKVSKEFAGKNEDNLGMSLFRRGEKKDEESVIPMPPGALFIGNLAYGNWVMDDSGRRLWEFHRAYKHLIGDFGWGKFRPDFEFYQKMRLHLQQGLAFHGNHKEFGTHGSASEIVIKAKTPWRKKYNFSWKKLTAKWLAVNTRKAQ